MHRPRRRTDRHWSRTLSGPTTFGLRGRIAATVAANIWLIGIAWSLILFLPVALPGYVYLLTQIWQKAWVIPVSPWNRLARLTPEERESIRFRRSDLRRLPTRSKLFLLTWGVATLWWLIRAA